MDKIEQIAEYLGVTPDYLLHIDYIDKEIYDNLWRLNDERKKTILEEIYHLNDKNGS
jgi:hypothetical protein